MSSATTPVLLPPPMIAISNFARLHARLEVAQGQCKSGHIDTAAATLALAASEFTCPLPVKVILLGTTPMAIGNMQRGMCPLDLPTVGGVRLVAAQAK